jgi:hypothetical protein
MSDIFWTHLPLEISRIDQMKVYTLQAVIYTIAKALYIH